MVRVSIMVGIADCCIQTDGKTDKMRINHVIKTDQWRSTPQIRILSCPTTLLSMCYGRHNQIVESMTLNSDITVNFHYYDQLYVSFIPLSLSAG